VQADEHNTGPGDDTALAMALAQAVRAVGRNLAADPRRVQAMVRDVLGSESRARRAEIDAVVVAAEEAVPEDLLAKRIDVGAAVDRLNDRGLAPDVSLFAVAVWRYALGLLEEHAEPPTLTNSVEQPSAPTATVGESATRPGAGAATSLGLDTVSSQPTDIVEPTQAGRPTPPPTSPGPGEAPAKRPEVLAGSPARRRWVPALVVAAIAATLVFVFTRGGSGESDASSNTDPTTTPMAAAPSTSAAPPTSAAPSTSAVPTTTAPPATTAPTTALPIATEPPLPSARFAAESTDVGDATRTWKADGKRLTGVVRIANPGDEAVTGWYYEVFPTSMVTSTDQVEPRDPKVPFLPFMADPVVRRYLVEVPPQGTVTVGYVVTLPEAPTQADLDAWKDDRAAAASEFRASAPTLTFDTPAGGVVTSGGTELWGNAPGAAVVTIDGVAVAGFEQSDGSGRWWQPITGLRSGVNTFTFVATSPYGVPTTATWTVNYRPPTTTTTKRNPGGGGGGGGTPTTTTTTTTKPPVVPPPP
jgi:hypothetical protein